MFSKSFILSIVLLLFKSNILLAQVVVVNSNTNWNISNMPPINVSSGIIISNGAVLMIDGISINFNPGAQVIVQSGSKLSCNSTILRTNSQNSPWNGITLNGNSGINQFTTSPNLNVLNNQSTWSGALNSNQTYCMMTNCTMENVITVVRVVDGAIFRVRNSFFKDFVCGVAIEAYTSSNFPLYNACYIMDCNFLWQTVSTYLAFVNNKNNLIGIKIEDADGVNIGGCDFECNYPLNERNLLERGYGIVISHSNVNISQSGDVWCLDEDGCLNNCSSQSQSKLNYFKKLSHGIFYDGLNINMPQFTDKKTISIRNSQFVNVFRDIQIKNSIQPVVAKINSSATRTMMSQLFLDYCDNTNTPPICSRKEILSIVDCNGLNVYKNDFYFDGLGCLFVIIKNCGKSSSSFINNTFIENSGMAVATNSAIGDDVYGLYLDGDCEGLNVHCNVFSDMGVDVYLDESAIFWKTINTVNYILGTESEAGNNDFSYLIPGRENLLIDVANNCPSNLVYNYYMNNIVDKFTYNNTGLGRMSVNLNINKFGVLPNCSSPCPKLFQSLSSSKIFKNANFQIYPNPAENELTVQNISEKDIINIYDVSGQLVLIKNNIQNNAIDISTLKPGMYFVKIIGISSSKKLKFVKI